MQIQFPFFNDFVCLTSLTRAANWLIWIHVKVIKQWAGYNLSHYESVQPSSTCLSEF